MKSQKVNEHIDDLRKVILRCRQCNLKMNPLKCVFRVSFDKLSRFTVYRKGIDLDPAKAKTSHEMEPPKTCKQLKTFMGEFIKCINLF